ncbi:MAG: hypothetical protein AB7O24_06920 [Kofleriaceae bacterium]
MSGSSRTIGDTETNALTDGVDQGPEPERASSRTTGPLEIELEVSRQRSAGWAAFGIVLGSLLIWKLGTVGVWAGVVLVVFGVFRAWEVVQSYLYPPGKIVISDDAVTLPRGLSLPNPLQLTPSDVTAVYFLRRSVPWNRAAPVLIVEVGARAIAFPRDWFSSEADQRRIVHALLRGRQAVTAPATAGDKLAIHRTPWFHLVGGAVLLAIGVIGIAISKSHGVADGDPYAIYVAPVTAGLILLWRGIAR